MKDNVYNQETDKTISPKGPFSGCSGASSADFQSLSSCHGIVGVQISIFF